MILTAVFALGARFSSCRRVPPVTGVVDGRADHGAAAAGAGAGLLATACQAQQVPDAADTLSLHNKYRAEHGCAQACNMRA